MASKDAQGSSSQLAAAQGIGVNWGMLGDNLPSKQDVVNLLRSRNITRVRLFNPDAAALAALRGSGIAVILGTRNEDLPRLGADRSFADAWVSANVRPYAGAVSFRCICAGNELIPGNLAANILPAMRNLDEALRAAGVPLPVSTAVHMLAVGVSYPPSQGAFSSAALPVLQPIAAFLAARRYPFLLNVYPYFAYADNTRDIMLDYALGTAGRVVVQDGPLGYTNLLDAMVDAVYTALEKVGGGGVELIISETGWPSAGGIAATVDNARAYNSGVVAKVKANRGTPKRPAGIETYIFALFNENLKPPGVEQNFGLFYPNMTEVYHLDFSGSI